MAGAPVGSSYRKYLVVATSTCEYVYVSLRAACKEAVWLRTFLSTTVSKCKDALKSYSKSHSGIKLANEAFNTEK